ncbi:hypothetical protein HHI36_005721 [Cryptolaemus montrouzieri]|uniref:Uncharacterized protein n=1 Tax=Cryptolaemus montrouzieri TaxID=559131 RepID=A0ABD2NUZ1_9CUCU
MIQDHVAEKENQTHEEEETLTSTKVEYENLLEQNLNLRKENDSLKAIVESEVDNKYQAILTENEELKRENVDLKDELNELTNRMNLEKRQTSQLKQEYLDNENMLSEKLIISNEKNIKLQRELSECKQRLKTMANDHTNEKNQGLQLHESLKAMERQDKLLKQKVLEQTEKNEKLQRQMCIWNQEWSSFYK